MPKSRYWEDKYKTILLLSLLLTLIGLMTFACVPLCNSTSLTQPGLIRHQNTCSAYQTSQGLKLEQRRLAVAKLKTGRHRPAPYSKKSAAGHLKSNAGAKPLESSSNVDQTQAKPNQHSQLINPVPEIPASSPDPIASSSSHHPPPPTSPSPRPNISSRRQNTRRPLRFCDETPACPAPIPAMPIPLPPPIIRRVILHVRDFFRSAVNHFHVLREYHHRPSYDPDAYLKPEDLANFPTDSSLHLDSLSTPQVPPPPPWPFENMSKYLIMNWFHSGSSQKSEGEINRLVKEVLTTPEFSAADLTDFTIRQGHKTLDEAYVKDTDNHAPYLTDDWQEVSVSIEIPIPQKGVAPKTFQVPGLHHRSITKVIKATWESISSRSFHLAPFKRIHIDPSTGQGTRIYDEVYTSDAWIEAHDKLQKQSNEPGCCLEKVIAGLMFWSDSTHLTNFGTASVWPLYMYFANLSKYTRARPTSGACHHIAYFPYLPDSLSDFLMRFLRYPSQRKPLLTHCKRELLHQAWRLLLDEEFVSAYQHGMVLRCYDGVLRRVYPRIFTYSADYPEKAALATIRERALCPCPRCLMEMKNVDKMGQKNDDKARMKKPRAFFSDLVQSARHCLYKLGYSIVSTKLDDLLKTFSLLPTMNAFVEKLGPLGFDPYPMFVMDLMHEFELGVWKATFIHILRVLNAAAPGGKLLADLNSRFRQIPTFGNDTIRRFSNNVSQMKKLAARDFEDILQNMIPAVEGLLPEPHNSMIMTLLYRLAEWHALAKLRMHTEHTLKCFDKSTTVIGGKLRNFRDISIKSFKCQELPKETAARQRQKERAQANKANSGGETSNPKIDSSVDTSAMKNASPPLKPKFKTLNLFTYKFHALGDYFRTICLFGTTDSYSTQIGELAHRLVKQFYTRTNKINAARNIAKLERRHTRLRRAREAARANHIRNHVHHVGFSDNDPLPRTDVDLHHHISDSTRYAHNLFNFARNPPNDPSKMEFIPRLKTHLLGRLLNAEFDGDEDLSTDEERNSVRIIGDRIFSSKIMRVNYTTYDMRRDQDSMNPRTHCDVMVLSPETGRNAHPFWYARILGVFHVQVLHTGPKSRNRSIQRMEFLWIRWFGLEPGYQFGFSKARLPKIGFVPETDQNAFGFLDPSLVLRGCHLVPAFSEGRTSALLKTIDPTAARPADETDDWANFYVIIWVDRDMFMRYLGGGIGHQNQNARWTSSWEDEGNIDEMDVDPTPEDEDLGNRSQMRELKELAMKMTTGAVGNDDDDEDIDSDSHSDNTSCGSRSSGDDGNLFHGSDESDEDDEEFYFGPSDDEGEKDNTGFGDF